MKRSRMLVLAAITSASILGASAFAADEPTQSQKSEISQDKSDKEVAAQYNDEAAALSRKAQSHRKLAQHYRHRKPPKGGASYDGVAKHCEKLADLYEQAAKEASAVASELSK